MIEAWASSVVRLSIQCWTTTLSPTPKLPNVDASQYLTNAHNMHLRKYQSSGRDAPSKCKVQG